MKSKIPTRNQQNVAKNLALYYQGIRFDSLKDLLIDAGYKLTSAESNAKQIITSKGVQEALVLMGLNETAIKAVISEILLLGTEEGRLRAAALGVSILGMKAPEKSIIVNADIKDLTSAIKAISDKK